uniref:LOB domain-containing protein n=1 Tax=Chenopodium quinoa TaxID=63459 RepID=A0A803MJN4_CHEQI
MKENGRKQGAVSPCAACKLLRRRCAPDCVFAPYFPADEPQKFANVHRVFGASNVNKMLQELPFHQRGDAVSSMVYEANARIRDPVYGCVGAISSLQQQIDVLQTQLAVAQAEELPMHQRGDAVSSMVYEANARVRDPVYGCVGAISSLQQQIDVLQAQLALAQAEVVHMRMRQYSDKTRVDHHQGTSSPENSPSSKIVSSQAKSLFMDMVVDQPNMEESLWSC